MQTLVQDRTADFPRCNHLPDGCMSEIKAAVKADGDESTPQGLFRLDDLLGFGGSGRQRFFAEYRLVVPQTLMHKLCMGGIG
jgi:hypothetical protein